MMVILGGVVVVMAVVVVFGMPVVLLLVDQLGGSCPLFRRIMDGTDGGGEGWEGDCGRTGPGLSPQDLFQSMNRSMLVPDQFQCLARHDVSSLSSPPVLRLVVVIVLVVFFVFHTRRVGQPILQESLQTDHGIKGGHGRAIFDSVGWMLHGIRHHDSPTRQGFPQTRRSLPFIGLHNDHQFRVQHGMHGTPTRGYCSRSLRFRGFLHLTGTVVVVGSRMTITVGFGPGHVVGWKVGPCPRHLDTPLRLQGQGVAHMTSQGGIRSLADGQGCIGRPGTTRVPLHQWVLLLWMLVVIVMIVGDISGRPHGYQKQDVHGPRSSDNPRGQFLERVVVERFRGVTIVVVLVVFVIVRKIPEMVPLLRQADIGNHGRCIDGVNGRSSSSTTRSRGPRSRRGVCMFCSALGNVALGGYHSRRLRRRHHNHGARFNPLAAGIPMSLTDHGLMDEERPDRSSSKSPTPLGSTHQVMPHDGRIPHDPHLRVIAVCRRVLVLCVHQRRLPGLAGGSIRGPIHDMNRHGRGGGGTTIPGRWQVVETACSCCPCRTSPFDRHVL